MPADTYNGEIKCRHCGGNMNYDKCRIENDAKSRGERCDCTGAKSKSQDKIVYLDGVAMVLGPHRKGQLGCVHNKDFGKTDESWAEFTMLERPVNGDADCPF